MQLLKMQSLIDINVLQLASLVCPSPASPPKPFHLQSASLESMTDADAGERMQSKAVSL